MTHPTQRTITIATNSKIMRTLANEFGNAAVAIESLRMGIKTPDKISGRYAEAASTFIAAYMVARSAGQDYQQAASYGSQQLSQVIHGGAYNGNISRSYNPAVDKVLLQTTGENGLAVFRNMIDETGFAATQ